MDRPQGFIFNITDNMLTWEKYKEEKPRLAVVLDYLWYEGNCPPFSSNVEGVKSGLHRFNYDFYFPLTRKFKRIFNDVHPFREITLFAVSGNNRCYFCMKPKIEEDKKEFSTPDYTFRGFKFSCETNEFDDFKEISDGYDNVKYFLSIKFDELQDVISNDEYDINSPWCFPVEIDGDCERIYRIIKRTGGELPVHRNYQENWSREYGSP
jgi:hypothetical protein